MIRIVVGIPSVCRNNVIYAEHLVFFLESGVGYVLEDVHLFSLNRDSGLGVHELPQLATLHVCSQFRAGGNKDILSALAGTGLWRA